MKFNKKLKELRNKNGITQANMAEQLGISARAYQHYETGTREPNIDKLIKLAIILNVSLDELLCKDN